MNVNLVEMDGAIKHPNNRKADGLILHIDGDPYMLMVDVDVCRGERGIRQIWIICAPKLGSSSLLNRRKQGDIIRASIPNRIRAWGHYGLLERRTG